MERTYVFNQDGGAASGNGLLASILPSLQNRGVDTGYLMGLLGGGNGNGGFIQTDMTDFLLPVSMQIASEAAHL